MSLHVIDSLGPVHTTNPLFSMPKSRKKPSANTIESLQSQLEVLAPFQVCLHSLLLQKLYVSRLDSSLIASIAADTNSLDEARMTLDPLAEASISEDQFQQNLTYGQPEGSLSVSTEEEEYVKIDRLSDGEAFKFLRITFPGPSDTELRSVIASSGGDVRKAVDILLNNEYIRNTAESAKSQEVKPPRRDVQDESEEEEESIWSQRRPGGVSRSKTFPSAAAKGPEFPSLGSSPSTSAWQNQKSQSPYGSRSQSPIRSKWDALDTQITFLSKSLSIPPSKVRSAFHVNASSLPRTLRDLLRDIPSTGRVDADIVANLKATFKDVDEESIRKIVVGTKHDIDCSMDLCRILEHDKYYTATLLRPSAPPARSNYKPAPTKIGLEPTGPKVVDDGTGSYEDMATLRSYYLEKRNEAFAAASQSYRQSKSDTLHSGVAAYYASIGRDYDTKYRTYSQLAANRLVASHSNSNTLDLHGVSVKDAVRIVEEAVTNWWSRVEVVRERGEVKAVESFAIVVGKGDRQKGGSRLGPPVAGWLRRNGWGFKEATGEFLVWGLRKDAKAG